MENATMCAHLLSMSFKGWAVVHVFQFLNSVLKNLSGWLAGIEIASVVDEGFKNWDQKSLLPVLWRRWQLILRTHFRGQAALEIGLELKSILGPCVCLHQFRAHAREYEVVLLGFLRAYANLHRPVKTSCRNATPDVWRLNFCLKTVLESLPWFSWIALFGQVTDRIVSSFFTVSGNSFSFIELSIPT